MEDKHLHSNFDYKSALSVQKGIEQPEKVSSSYLEKVRANKRKEPTVEELVDGILHGDRTLLSRAITLIESTLPAHQEKAQTVLERCLPYSGKSVRLGITGVPGAGKSTVIESLGTMLTAHNHKVAVLAIGIYPSFPQRWLVGRSGTQDTRDNSALRGRRIRRGDNRDRGRGTERGGGSLDGGFLPASAAGQHR